MTLIRIVGIAAVALSFSVQSSQIVVDTSFWTDAASPSSNKNSKNDKWVRVHSDTPTKLSNSSGALISDFSVDGNFNFSGIFSPTFASNGSCASENTCDDDDILGLVFGWQDASNHYRLGWSQGDGSNSSGLKDITGKTGLFLVKEENGDSNTIMNWSSDFWLEDVEYIFDISRVADTIRFGLKGLMQNTAGVQGSSVPSAPVSGSVFKNIEFSVFDNTFTSSRVGIYTESQTAMFKSLNVNVPSQANANSVSAPATISFAMLGGLALLFSRRKAR
jgi:uncharacterized protein (TIGR03382 family)